MLKIKCIISFSFCLCFFHLIGQSDPKIEKKWNQTQREIEFGKDPKSKESTDWYNSSPHYVSSDEGIVTTEQTNESFEENIKKSREGEKKGGKEKSSDKEMKETEMAEPPEFDPPEIDGPDVDIDAPNPFEVSQSTWKTILILLIFAAAITGLYFWLKKQNSNPKIIQEVDDDWNPEIVTKPELEMRLENALKTENYRECIRIYFTMILQLLIAQNQINWRREKTNHEYLFEIKSTRIKKSLANCIRIFDLVWYGEYHLDKTRFEQIQTHFHSLLNELKESSIEE